MRWAMRRRCARWFQKLISILKANEDEEDDLGSWRVKEEFKEETKQDEAKDGLRHEF